jgi:hypothetical protein
MAPLCRDFDPPQVVETVEVKTPKNRPPNPSRFKFEKVNEVALKLTNGETILTPTSHGQWAGYRTTKAVAWVINVHQGQWLARDCNMVCGPLSLAKAKAAAIAMAKGAVGDYHIANPLLTSTGLPRG